MYMCCKHCKHTGSFYHERGHNCKKHDFFVNLNSKVAMEKMFDCEDCQLSIDKIFDIARYMDTISFEIVFDDTFHVMNNMGVVIKDSHKWSDGFYRLYGYSFTDVYEVRDVDNSHVVGYRLLFNGFPVFYTESKDELEFIKDGLGL